jgi:predicted  nucleic acid-binding Zn-ribbon protein
MNPRSMPPAQLSPQPKSDLDSTAELPVLDAAGVPVAQAPAETQQGGTDTWVVLPGARAAQPVASEDNRPQDAKLLSLSKQLRETQELLATRGERLAQLEHARDEARSAHAAAEQRASALSLELAGLREQTQRAHAELAERAGTLDAQLKQLLETSSAQATEIAARLEEATRSRSAAEARAAVAEQRVGILVGELDQHTSGAAQHALQYASQLEDAQRGHSKADERAISAEQRALNAVSDLEQHRIAAAAQAAQQATQLEDALRTRAGAEQRAAALVEELAQVRRQMSEQTVSAAEQESRMQRRFDEQERIARAQRAQDLVEHEGHLARGRAQVLQVSQDLNLARAGAVSYIESLQSTEGRRLISEEQVLDLHHEVNTRAAIVARQARELSGHESQLREKEKELALRAERITKLEQESSTLTATLEQRDTQLREARQESQGLHTSITRLQSELGTTAARLRELESESAKLQSTDSQLQSELERLRTQRADLDAEVDFARAAATSAETRLATLESGLPAERARAAQLESALAAERTRTQQLEAELSTVRTEMDSWGTVLRATQEERGGHLSRIAAAETRAHQLEQELTELRDTSGTTDGENETLGSRVRELEGDLRAAEDAVHRLESEARNRVMRLDELERSNQQLRASSEEPRSDSGPAEPPRDAGRVEAEVFGPEPPPDNAVRLLIQSGDSGREIVHVLGRKTSIGRTPENDMQIDAKYVSRHHAVILVGPAYAVIEDLNSTNGVTVNGKRVTRHTLRDGDQVAIGRAQYRFAVRRSNAEKR